MAVRILVGDCREQLKTLEPQSVHCAVTSPPYWGLRDYGADGQLGLESTPEEHVAVMVDVFRDVWRVLRDDGTLWLNYGDSYSGGGGFYPDAPSNTPEAMAKRGAPGAQVIGARIKGKPCPPGLKPKDLVGMPWLVAKALQAPYYKGEIKRETDRAWLAAMIDGEGTICGFKHKRKDDGRTRTGAQVFVTNCNQPLLDHCQTIWPASRHEHQKPRENRFSDKDCWRWVVFGSGRKAALLAELYPYLIAKKAQAHVAWNLLQFVQEGKRLGRGEHGSEVREKRALLTEILSRLNHGESPAMPGWLKPMPDMYEPGWYLRSDIIWKKPNPMPESVTDRPTKAHEYVFLLTKKARYFYDADAVREAQVETSAGYRREFRGGGSYTGGNSRNNSAIKRNVIPGNDGDVLSGRNLRTVWTIPTHPFPGAHFATFPPKLVEPCIKAGTSEHGVCAVCGAPWVREVEAKYHHHHNTKPTKADGVATTPGADKSGVVLIRENITTGWRSTCKHDDHAGRSVVLDPFGGAGTVGLVADRLQRDAVLCELNEEYAEMARKRISGDCPMFANVTVREGE